jgi:asparagine synthase (glutamine-hydrolysing)
MCGIVGIFDLNNTFLDVDLLAKMTNAIRHRGPDGEGYLLANTVGKSYELAGGQDTSDAIWASHYPFSPKKKIGDVISQAGNFNMAFGHRRLSIIDLSPASHQPMCNENGTIWIVYEGEIYNYVELREELRNKGYRFRTHGDTEVILYAYEEWGYSCLNKFNGMWAFALWDSCRGRIFCARDRFGIKPFYYYIDGKLFAFASEIKALLEHPQVKRQLNEEAVYNYLMWGFVDHSADTFFSGIRQLASGHYLLLDRLGGISIEKWWHLDVHHGLEDISEIGVSDVAGKLASLLEDSVRIRLRSDVPIGACLSGGLDSSSIVCLANKLMFNDGAIARKIVGDRQRTFSSCHNDQRVDERKFIEAVIQRTGAEKNYVFPDGTEMWEELPEMVRHLEEPFGGTSFYAQWCVIKKAKERGIKVLLDGGGGDELLAGYHSYYGTFLLNLFLAGKLARCLSEANKIAGLIGLANMLSITGMVAATSIYRSLPLQLQIAGSRLHADLRGTHMHRYINQSFSKKFFRESVLHLRDLTGSYMNLQERLSLDVYARLGGDLRYQDRASTAFAVEVRVPFLDYRLVEFVFSLPASYKIHGGWTKWILREAMKGIIPEEIRLRQDKLGFPTPERQWLSQNRESIVRLFSDSNCMVSSFVNPRSISGNIDDFIKSEVSAEVLWRIINLEIWLRTFFMRGNASLS